jgi:hypothetical protein
VPVDEARRTALSLTDDEVKAEWRAWCTSGGWVAWLMQLHRVAIGGWGQLGLCR